MTNFGKSGKMGKVLGLIGLAGLLVLMSVRPAAYRETSSEAGPMVLVSSHALPIPTGLDPAAIEAALKKSSPAPAPESAKEREPGKVSLTPKIPRFALPAGLNLAALNAIVKKCAQEQGVNEDLVWAVIRQESGGDPRAVSPKGAMGLMQLMPGTAACLGVTNPFDPEQNISGGIRYLLECLDRFQQDVRLALAAYNAGPGNVIKYNGCPPFAETRNYVAAVMQVYQRQWRPPDLEDRDDNSLVGSLRSRGISGLAWRVPLARWKIVKPQVNMPAPHWKGRQRPS